MHIFLSQEDKETSHESNNVGGSIVSDKVLFFQSKSTDFFPLSLNKHIICEFWLEAFWQSASNEYPPHMGLWKNKNEYLFGYFSYRQLHGQHYYHHAFLNKSTAFREAIYTCASFNHMDKF